MNMKAGWERIAFDGTPIYVRPDAPDWFVLNQATDDALLRLSRQGENSSEIKDLLMRIDDPTEDFYDFRNEQLELDSLRECWFHLTNRCNMKCGHCMFKSSPHARDELSKVDCSRMIHEAYELGCRLYYFTGGEPFLSGAFSTSLRETLGLSDTHAVILTNLSLISQKKGLLREVPRERLHFQVSIDGLGANHDSLRGPNAYRRLKNDLNTLKALGFPVTLSMTVTHRNVHEMEKVIDVASLMGISNVHYLWLFQKGNADNTLFVKPGKIFSHLKDAQKLSEKAVVKIDNVEILRPQVFSCPGTRYDLSNAGWQSLAVGPDGYIYPTPALIYTKEMRCGHIREGLQQVWRNSEALKRVRGASLNSSEAYRRNPLRYIVGGGDIDHSYIHGGRITDSDPYVELYNSIFKWLTVREANRFGTDGYPSIRPRMGETLGDCPAEGNRIFFTHPNCVLSLPGNDNRTRINQFYSRAAEDTQEEILNLVISDITYTDNIPLKIKYNETLRGECIGGALKYNDLFGLLNDIGFSHSRIVSGYHYREVKGYDFYSVTYRANKPASGRTPVLYGFPEFNAVMAAVETEPTCACFVTPNQKHQVRLSGKTAKKTGCMVCGAAVGVGIAFSILLAASPYDGDKRRKVQQVTQKVLAEIAAYDAPRCCQRDCWIALKAASRLLKKELGVELALHRIACEQYVLNKECIYGQCPLWPRREQIAVKRGMKGHAPPSSRG